VDPLRWQIAGFDAIEIALRAGQPVRVLLVNRDDLSAATSALIELAVQHAVTIWRGSEGDLRRMSRGDRTEEIIAMAGPVPMTDLDGLLERGGAVWLMHRATYPSNAGFAVRTAEVSGASGIVIDAAFNHAERGRVEHVSMGAADVMPVVWESTERTIERAQAHGHRIVALEDTGEHAPWQVDLTGSVLLLLGSERDGIGPELLARCDAVVRVPMAGFVPSYNLQAAMSMVAAERLRQLHSNHMSMCAK
jgi:23S rRNA (guanosine2251-2'-O)-methyltransferase